MKNRTVPFFTFSQTKATYEAYYRSIRSQIPPDLSLLRELVNIHDGHLRLLQYDTNSKTIVLMIEASDPTVQEHVPVQLEYLKVAHITMSGDPEKGLPGPYAFGDIGMDEIEVLDDTLEHRILFSSGIEIQIRFGDFRLYIMNVNYL